MELRVRYYDKLQKLFLEPNNEFIIRTSKNKIMVIGKLGPDKKIVNLNAYDKTIANTLEAITDVMLLL